ncbi:MAG: pyruvate kinase [Candidatus Altimarinota bacterium]
MKKRTKIIATVGPATASSEMLLALSRAGVNIIRFNFSHADYDSATLIIDRIRDLNKSGKTSLALLLDTKGPELRTGDLKEKIQYQIGERFRIYTQGSNSISGEKSITCDYPYLIEDISIGDAIEIDSGLFHAVVIAKGSDFLDVEAKNDAIIGSRRHVNLPGIKIRMPGITEKDKQDLLFAIKMGFHFIAASFIRTEQNVREIREFLDENSGDEIKIISKIENEEGIENLDSIVGISDGVMVARGDLGIEVPIEKVPKYQKRIIDLCRQRGKFVIVATHMLESMIEHPFPTRAEVSDIFRAVLQGADATMLSGETTTGKYPIESVDMMRSVILEAEGELEHKHHEYVSDGLTERDIEKKYLIRSALHIAEELHLKTVLVFTKSGRLARLAAAYRPNISIEAFSGNPSSVGYMQVLYGVTPHILPHWGDHQKNLEDALKLLLDAGTINLDSKIIAVTDVVKNSKEIPVMEIIRVGDIFH